MLIGGKMRKVFKIYKRDLKSIVKNKGALIIVIGLCILPSLYAWINIKACWDPYANTGNLPIAIVNEDEGAEFNGKNINAGDNIVASLKKNKSIDWIFIDEWQGNYGLNEGKYYALIEIPNDFTKGLVSLTTSAPKKPSIIYRDNEKLNAIAAKITSAAKDKLTYNIESSFNSVVDKEAFNILNGVGSKVSVNKAQIVQINDTVKQAYDDIGSIINYINSASNTSKSLKSFLSDSKTKLPEITDQINNLQSATEASKTLVLSTKDVVDTAALNLNNDMVQLGTLNNEYQQLLQKLKDINNGVSTDNITNTINQMSNISNSMTNLIDGQVQSLEAVNNTISNQNITNAINSLQALETIIKAQKTALTQLNNNVNINASKNANNTVLDNLSNLGNQVTSSLTGISNQIYNVVIPVLDNYAENTSSSLDNVSNLLEAEKVIVPQLNAVADFGMSTSDVSVNQASELNSRLASIQSQLKTLMDKMKNMDEGTIDKIVKLLDMNPGEISSFLSSPIDLKQVDVYGDGVFGVGLTPFYTVLAIWVGALLLSSLLSVECMEFEHEKLTLRQKHFGKMLLFLSISQVQAFIVTIGDKFILGVNPENMPLMIAISQISAFTFTVIIFTLVSLFGNVGKAIAVVIMVFQIAGSGGIYPIQTNPEVFGLLQPLWPFTYAISGFREAIAGPIWSNVYFDVCMLLVFVVVFIVASRLKKYFHKVTEFMEHKFKEAGI